MVMSKVKQAVMKSKKITISGIVVPLSKMIRAAAPQVTLIN